VLSEDLGGMVESMHISETYASDTSLSSSQLLIFRLSSYTECRCPCRNPATPQQAVRLPPPNPNAFKMLTPTASAAAVELRQRRQEGGESDLPVDQVTPEPCVSVRAGAGGHGTPFLLPTKDPLRSARASPAQLPQGGLTELQKVLARRRGGQ
jgi:hypothetical protein